MAETEFKYDVFISYSHKDEEWVRNILLPTLEKQALKVCIDYRDFIAGKPAIINMQDASEASRHTILVLTPNWVESEWTLYESILSRTDDPSGLQRRTIPLILAKCKPPKFISILSWVDFTDKKREAETWQSLFRSLDKEGEKIEIERGSAADWFIPHPYPMPPNFTGRATELKMLNNWLADDKDRLFIVRALGGFGKSALAWQWVNTRIDTSEWTKLVWWSFYEAEASFENFIDETLKYLSIAVPQGQRPQVDELLKAMKSQKILLIMDGFERSLRAYSSMNAVYHEDESSTPEDHQLDCVNINAEAFLRGVCSLPNIKSKVLMTTRLTPRVIKSRGEFVLGCREEELTSMQKQDAVEFFHKQKIQGTHAEIEAACATYGYHPLSLRLLAGRILTDLHKPGDISVAQTIKVDGNLKQLQNHILKVAYESLSEQQQKLLSQIACFRSPLEMDTLRAISGPVKTRGLLGFFKRTIHIYNGELDNDLQWLIECGLLYHSIRAQHPHSQSSIFDLHPIVRRYAYDRLSAPNRAGIHERLVSYFEAVPSPEKVQNMEDLAPVIELYYHMVTAGQLDKAWLLFRNRIWRPLYYQLGGYQTQIELLTSLFVDGEDKAPKVKNESHQANELANAYSLSGQPRRAVPLYKRGLAHEEKRGDKSGIAIALGNLASLAQIRIGALKDAEDNLRRCVGLLIEAQDSDEGFGHALLGELLCYRGAWEEAQQELDKSLALAEKQNDVQLRGVALSYRALHFILRMRDQMNYDYSAAQSMKLVVESAGRALDFVEEDARTTYPITRNFVHAYWLLGAAHRMNGDLNEAEGNLSRAIGICRQINLVEIEANILLELAKLSFVRNDFDDTKDKAGEAVSITERCGYVLQGADVNLFLAQYTLEQEKDKAKAKEYAETALKLAYCDGPPYHYKVAYEEAERMLRRVA